MRRIMQAACQDIGRILLAVCCNVHFREIQVELRLPAIHPHRGVAEFFGFRPFLLGRCDCNSYIRNVKGIRWLMIESRPQMRQRSERVTSAEECKAGAEFLECLEMDHIGSLLKEIGTRRTKQVAANRPAETQKTLRIRLGAGTDKKHCSHGQKKDRRSFVCPVQVLAARKYG